MPLWTGSKNGRRLPGVALAAVLLLVTACNSGGGVKPANPADPAPGAVTPAPTTSDRLRDVTDVAFVSAEQGFAVSFHGAIYKTGDGGTTWHQVHRVDGARFEQVIFVGDQVGFAVGNKGCDPGPNCEGPALLLRTTDGAKTWEAVEPDGITDQMRWRWPVQQFRFISASVGFATTDPAMDTGAPLLPQQGSGVLHTTDGGKTWRPLTLPEGARAHGGSLRDAQHGAVITSSGGKHGILITADGGKTWRQAYTSEVPLYTVQWVGEREAFAAGGNVPKFGFMPRQLLVKTSDGGQTWQEVYASVDKSSYELHGLHLTSATAGFVTTGTCTMGQNGPCNRPLLYMSDGGRTWRDTGAGDRVVRFSAVGNKLWVVSGDSPNNDAVVRYSPDAGQSWKTLSGAVQ